MHLFDRRTRNHMQTPAVPKPKTFFLNNIFSRQCAGSFQTVSQLSHVSRPVMFLKPATGLMG